MDILETDAKRIGTHQGEIKFGHVDVNGVMSGVQLRNGPPGQPAEHYMQFCSTGDMKNGTINRCPGTYQIHCGEIPTDGMGFILNVQEGDIVLRTGNGRIRLIADNIDLKAKGSNGKNGYVNIDGDEKVTIRSKRILVDGSSVAKFFSSGLCEIVGKNATNLYGGLLDCTDGATSVFKGKYSSNITKQESKDIT
jgi:hypothetical protein